jgi:hypothetical protein
MTRAGSGHDVYGGEGRSRPCSGCPHPNACLTCDNFLTTVEFLPAHRDQFARTDELIAAARDSGAQRLVEMNEPVRVNLIRIIEGLDALPTLPDACSDDG